MANTLTQETLEKIPEVSSEAPKLPPYVTSDSAPSDGMMSKEGVDVSFSCRDMLMVFLSKQ